MDTKSRELVKDQILKERDDNKLEPLRLQVAEMVLAGNRQALILQKSMITADLYTEELFMKANEIVDEGITAVDYARERGA